MCVCFFFHNAVRHLFFVVERFQKKTTEQRSKREKENSALRNHADVVNAERLGGNPKQSIAIPSVEKDPFGSKERAWFRCRRSLGISGSSLAP